MPFSVKAGKLAGLLLGVFLLMFSGDVLAIDDHVYQSEALEHCNAVGNAALAYKNGLGGTQFKWHTGDGCRVSGTKTYECYVVQTNNSGNAGTCSAKLQSGVENYHRWSINGDAPGPCDDLEPGTSYTPQESGDICVDIDGNWCQFTPTTNQGNCDDQGPGGGIWCWVTIEPTGESCVGPGEPQEPQLPTNCIRNESTGAVSCDCSVDPYQSFCLDPEIDDHGLPGNCIRNESTGKILCYTDPNDPDNPINPQSPDPDQPGNPGTVPGDDDGDGLCETGEACEGDNVANELLQDILDELKGDGLNLGDDAATAVSKIDAKFNKELADMQKGKEGAEGDMFGEITGAGDDIQSVITGFFTTSAACPEIEFSLGNGNDVEIDTGQVVSAIKGVSAFIMWALTFFAIYLIWFRLVFR